MTNPLQKGQNQGMDIVFFFQIVAAVFVGGILLAMALWGAWTIERLERSGTPRKDLPWRPGIFILLPAVIVLGALFTLT